MKTAYALILFFLSIPWFAGAQLELSGTVYDKQSGNELPFVNIGISGTAVGTQSNENGNFRLQVPGEHADKLITFSSVGYHEFQIPAEEAAKRGNLKISLEAFDYSIDEVVVEDQSYFPYLLLKRAVDNIHKNYIQKPHNYRLWYDSRMTYNDTLHRERQAVLLLYDSRGYSDKDFYEGYVNRNYRFIQSKRNFEVRTARDGYTWADELLSFDIVRTGGNILKNSYKNEFDVKIQKSEFYRGDSVWILSYECRKPGLVTTGFYYPENYSGEIYISKENYAVVKNQSRGEIKHLSRYGRDLYIPEPERKHHPENVSFNFTVEYEKSDGYYRLSEIAYSLEADKSNFWKTSDAHFKVKKVILDDPEIIEQRDYIENQSYSSDFRTNYSNKQ